MKMDYQGVVFKDDGESQSVTIKADSLDEAKARMVQKFGPETSDMPGQSIPKTNWVCGLSTHSFAGIHH